MEYNHVSVLLNESVNALNPTDNGVYFDGTLGGCGHSEKILKMSSPNGKLIATDLDTDAIENAVDKLKDYKGRFIIFNDNFKNFLSVLEQSGYTEIDGAILDLGISSHQLEADRGFAYMTDSRLDMRMDKNSTLSALEVVNDYSEERLTDIFFKYGEEKFSKRIANRICKERQIKPIITTGELVKIIDESIPAKLKGNGHSAKRVFQSIRIEINGELTGLDKALRDIVSKLKKGGRLAVITFHSLEDKIVKDTFNDLQTDCICDKRIPICVCGKKREVKLVNTKPILPSEQELANNSRAKSAKLRIVEKL